MRAFIAFDASDEAKEFFRKVQKEISQEGNFTFPKEFHLTLKFLGDVHDEKVEEIKNRLGNLEFEKITASLDGIGFFPDEKMIRIVWIGIEPKKEIKELQKNVDDLLEGILPRETRFEPHITLARVKSLKDKKGFVEMMKKISVEKIEFVVDKVKLIKSTLTREGPIYEDLESFNSKQSKNL